MNIGIHLIAKDRMDSIIPLLAQLNPNIAENILKGRLQHMLI